MEQKFLSIRAAAKYSSLSERSLYLVVSRKKIRHYRIGKRIVIDVTDLDEFIRRGIQEPEAGLNPEATAQELLAK